MPNATSKDRSPFDPTFLRRSTGATVDTSPALTHGAAGTAQPSPRARLIWRDPVTGEDLELEIAATPELLQSLARAGFRPAADPGEHEAA